LGLGVSKAKTGLNLFVHASSKKPKRDARFI